jgi:Kinetochore complex Sim4 subunit Fta1
VTLEYDNATYKAALLVGPDVLSQRDDRTGSTYLPVLLTRLPGPLRQSFLSFLGTAFDTYPSVLRLPSSFLCARLEAYTASLTQTPPSRDDEGNRSRRSSSSDASVAANDITTSTTTSRAVLEGVMKDVQLTLAFSPPVAPALKTLDVHVPRESFASFTVGDNASNTAQKISPPQPPEPSSGEGQAQASVPFLNSLTTYFERHLAMKLDLGGTPSSDRGASGLDVRQPVRFSKVACSAFVLGAAGRIKITADPGDTEISTTGNGPGLAEDSDHERMKNRRILRANEGMLRALVLRATGRDAENEEE